MKLISATFAISLTFASTHAFAADAKIHAKNEDGKSVVIALDSKGTPRENLAANRYPSIKDFRDDHQYSDFCYEGAPRDSKNLLTQLVLAADGDGDSWAELKSIKTDKAGVIEVIALITDESGEKEESYSFSPCK